VRQREIATRLGVEWVHADEGYNIDPEGEERLMSAHPHSGSNRVVTFRGGVSCRRDSHGPLGLTLIGWTSDHPEEKVTLAFSGRAPDTLPEVLEDAKVDRLADGRYRIVSTAREWTIEARAIHLHREIATAFYRAIPPRPAPWIRRLLFRVLLGLVATGWGKRLLLALRR
jgi:hypothetical protein